MATWESTRLLEELIELSERRLGLAFGALVRRIQEQVPLSQFAAGIARGDWSSTFDIIERAAGEYASAVNSLYLNAGAMAVQEMANALGVVVSFDQANPRAVQFMQRNRLELIQGFTSSQRDLVREVVTSGIETGLNPRAQARALRESIGLTRQQEKWVQNYRRELEDLDPRALERRLTDGRFDRSVRRAIERGMPLSREQIDRFVGRYRERFINYRAETIARNEALRSVHAGIDEAITQAVESGEIDGTKARSMWNTALDERVRSSHSAMHRQQQPYGEPFISGDGNALRYPGDPAAPASDSILCRCRVSTRITN